MRILLTFKYNGKDFHGFQYQRNQRTVQDEIERRLTEMNKTFTRIHPASRTDKGVHALEQYCHFDTDLNIQPDKWKYILNRILPDDIYVSAVHEVHKNFHARYRATGKTYRYKIYTTTERDPFYNGLKTHHPAELNVKDMQKAMTPFIGTHDFTSFSSAKASANDKVRHISEFKIIETKDGFDFVITGSGFLYNMVRIIVAYVLEVGEGRREADTLNLISRKDRRLVPRTAPGEGLYLERIHYAPGGDNKINEVD